MKKALSLALFGLGVIFSAPSSANIALDESQIKQLFVARGVPQLQNISFQVGEFVSGRVGAVVALDNPQNHALAKEVWLLDFDKQWKVLRKLADSVNEFRAVDLDNNGTSELFIVQVSHPAQGIQKTRIVLLTLNKDSETVLFDKTALDNTGVTAAMVSQFQEHQVQFEDVDKDGLLELVDTEIKIGYLGNKQSDSFEKKTIYKLSQGRLQVFDPNAPAKAGITQEELSFTAAKMSDASKSSIASVDDKTRMTLGAGVRVRTQPKATAKEVTRLQIGTLVRELEKNVQSEFLGDKRDYWYKVVLSDGKQGWVFGSFIEPVALSQLPEKYIALAKTQLANENLQFSDWVDVVNFLNRVRGEVSTTAQVDTLTSLRQQALARSLKSIPEGQEQQSPYQEWIKEQADLIRYHNGTWQVK